MRIIHASRGDWLPACIQASDNSPLCKLQPRLFRASRSRPVSDRCWQQQLAVLLRGKMEELYKSHSRSLSKVSQGPCSLLAVTRDSTFTHTHPYRNTHTVRLLVKLYKSTKLTNECSLCPVCLGCYIYLQVWDREARWCSPNKMESLLFTLLFAHQTIVSPWRIEIYNISSSSRVHKPVCMTHIWVISWIWVCSFSI